MSVQPGEHNSATFRGKTSKSPGSLMEPLQVKGGVVKKGVLHLHLPRLQRKWDSSVRNNINTRAPVFTFFDLL